VDENVNGEEKTAEEYSNEYYQYNYYSEEVLDEQSPTREAETVDEVHLFRGVGTGGSGGFGHPIRPIREGLSLESLKFHPAPPCPTLLCPAGRPPPKRPYGRLGGGLWPSSSSLDTPSRMGLHPI
jgi:hypothetical protein